MSSQVITQNKPTAKPVIAGIFDIVIGGGILLAVTFLIIAGLIVGTITFPFLDLLVLALGIPAIAFGMLILLGGIFALQRKRWGWVLAGSIAAIVVSSVLGITATVLIAVSKDEFSG
jgi:hypothetical protein